MPTWQARPGLPRRTRNGPDIPTGGKCCGGPTSSERWGPSAHRTILTMQVSTTIRRRVRPGQPPEMAGMIDSSSPGAIGVRQAVEIAHVVGTDEQVDVHPRAGRARRAPGAPAPGDRRRARRAPIRPSPSRRASGSAVGTADDVDHDGLRAGDELAQRGRDPDANLHRRVSRRSARRAPTRPAADGRRGARHDSPSSIEP